MKTKIYLIKPNFNTDLLHIMDGYIHMNKGDIITLDFGKYEVDRTSLDIETNKGVEAYLIFVK